MVCPQRPVGAGSPQAGSKGLPVGAALHCSAHVHEQSFSYVLHLLHISCTWQTASMQAP